MITKYPVTLVLLTVILKSGASRPDTMADLEAVLADVSYLMAMEKSKCTPAARKESED